MTEAEYNLSDAMDLADEIDMESHEKIGKCVLLKC